MKRRNELLCEMRYKITNTVNNFQRYFRDFSESCGLAPPHFIPLPHQRHQRLAPSVELSCAALLPASLPLVCHSSASRLPLLACFRQFSRKGTRATGIQGLESFLSVSCQQCSLPPKINFRIRLRQMAAELTFAEIEKAASDAAVHAVWTQAGPLAANSCHVLLLATVLPFPVFL